MVKNHILVRYMKPKRKDYTKEIKMLTITALMNDDLLIGLLVLKGGNALNLGYDVTDRGSIDIDFSMEKDFTEEEKVRVNNQIRGLLDREFRTKGLTVFDVIFSDRPSRVHESVKDFWGGYSISFKTIQVDMFEKYKEDKAALQRNAISISSTSSTVFQVDISKYEYIGSRQQKMIDGNVIQIYSPEMLALEKLRALCQQNPKYKDVVISITSKSRARDFYDIYSLNENFKLDFQSEENIEICKNIFAAKRVPLEYIEELSEQKVLHNQSWNSVIDTIGIEKRSSLKSYDYYFDYVYNLFSHLHTKGIE